MGVYAYPPEVHEFVKENMTRMRDRDLAKACNEALGTSFTEGSMKSFKSNHKYRSGLSRGLTREELWERQAKYPKELLTFVRENSWGVSSKRMAEMVNEKYGTDFTPNRMKGFRQRWGIRSGETGWYQKGHDPGTKGKTLEEICKHDPEKIARVRATQFKKGDRPLNELPVGSVTKTTDGYLIRKISMTGSQWERWEFIHRATWEEHHGPIPEGMVITFRDGNRENCDISNLTLISRGEAMLMAKLGLWTDDTELNDLGLSIVKLRKAVADRKKRR